MRKKITESETVKYVIRKKCQQCFFDQMDQLLDPCDQPRKKPEIKVESKNTRPTVAETCGPTYSKDELAIKVEASRASVSLKVAAGLAPPIPPEMRDPVVDAKLAAARAASDQQTAAFRRWLAEHFID